MSDSTRKQERKPDRKQDGKPNRYLGRKLDRKPEFMNKFRPVPDVKKFIAEELIAKGYTNAVITKTAEIPTIDERGMEIIPHRVGAFYKDELLEEDTQADEEYTVPVLYMETVKTCKKNNQAYRITEFAILTSSEYAELICMVDGVILAKTKTKNILRR